MRRFQQFLESNDDVRYCKDLGLRGIHKLIFRGVGGRTILLKDAELIVKVHPHDKILIVGENDVISATSP